MFSHVPMTAGAVADTIITHDTNRYYAARTRLQYEQQHVQYNGGTIKHGQGSKGKAAVVVPHSHASQHATHHIANVILTTCLSRTRFWDITHITLCALAPFRDEEPPAARNPIHGGRGGEGRHLLHQSLSPPAEGILSPRPGPPGLLT